MIAPDMSARASQQAPNRPQGGGARHPALFPQKARKYAVDSSPIER
jgi:hypothetical protein